MKSADEISTSPSSMLPVYDSDNLRRMVALYDYDPQELSPNVDAEVLNLELPPFFSVDMS